MKGAMMDNDPSLEGYTEEEIRWLHLKFDEIHADVRRWKSSIEEAVAEQRAANERLARMHERWVPDRS